MPNWRLVNPLDKADILWDSSNEQCPSFSHLEERVFKKYLRRSQSLSASEISFFLSDLSAQVLRKAPARFVGILISSLSCALWEDGDPRKLYHLQNANDRAICGVVFKVGEIVWTCRQCAKDSTCVQCNACFKASDHEGHEVYFHKASAAGGCCDCGDPEAWAICGNCTKHSGVVAEEDPLVVVPEALQKGMEPVLKGALGVVMSWSVDITRAYNWECAPEEKANIFTNVLNWTPETNFDYDFDTNPFMRVFAKYKAGEGPLASHITFKSRYKFWTQLKQIKEKYCVVVHNDDIHTYEDVSKAFQTLNMSLREAEKFTKDVDVEGYRVVHTEMIDGAHFDALEEEKLEALRETFLKLSKPHGSFKKGLLVSILPQRLLEMESRIVTLFAWMHEIGKQNDGICRFISNVLLLDVEELPGHANALDGDVYPHKLMHGDVRPCDIFQTISSAYSSDEHLIGQLTGYEPFVELEFPNSIRELMNISENATKNTPENHLRLMQQPFKTNCVRKVLSVLLAASPYLLKRVKEKISSLVVIYQQDFIFKYAFSQILTILYPCLYGMFAQYIGTRADEVFGTTVQVYTANRIVTMMSSDGFSQRLLPEPAHSYVCIAHMLADTIYSTLLEMGCVPRDSNEGALLEDGDSGISKRDTFLVGHGVQSHRHQQLFRDFEYVTENVTGNLNLLSGERDAGMLDTWVKICELLQGMYSVKRKVESHVREEDMQRWHASTNLTIELESASTNVISNSMFPSEEALLAELQVASGVHRYAVLENEIASLQNVALDHASKVFIHGLQEYTTLMSVIAARTGQTSALSMNQYFDSLYANEALGDLSMLKTEGLLLLQRNQYGDISAKDAPSTERESHIPNVPRNGSNGIYVERADGNDSTTSSSEGSYYRLLTCLGEIVDMPVDYNFKRFRVSTDWVSINIPIHRLIAKLFLFSAHSDLNFINAFQSLSTADPEALINLADYPIRILSFMTQVTGAMWKRNGQAVENLAYNYNFSPINKTLKIMDIHCIQIALIALGRKYGPNILLALLIDRYEVNLLLNSPETYYFEAVGKCRVAAIRNTYLAEYQGTMLAGLLKVLIDVMTCTPNTLVKKPIFSGNNPDLSSGNSDVKKEKSAMNVDKDATTYFDSISKALCREVVNLTLSGSNTLGRIQNVCKQMIGGDKTVTDKDINEVICKTCTQRNSREAGEAMVLEVKAEALKYYDPEHTHRNQDQLNNAAEKVRETREIDKQSSDAGSSTKSDNDDEVESIPLFMPEAISHANAFFEPVRDVLFQPLFYKLLSKSLSLACTKDSPLARATRVVAERVLYLMTLHICIKKRTEAGERPRCYIPSQQSYYVYRHKDSPDRSSSSTPWNDKGAFVRQEKWNVGDYLKKCEDTHEEVKWNIDVDMTLSVDSVEHTTLIDNLVQLYNSNIFADDATHRNALFWVLESIALDKSNIGMRSYLAERDLKFVDPNDGMETGDTGSTKVDARKAELARLKANAQRNVMLNMNSQAAKFMAEMEDLSSSDEDEQEEEFEVSGRSVKAESTKGANLGAGHDTMDEDQDLSDSLLTLEEKTPRCIICRESGSSDVGTLAFMQASNTIANSILRSEAPTESIFGDNDDTDYTNMENLKRMYRVTSKSGCIVYASPNNESMMKDQTSNTKLVGKIQDSNIVGRLAYGEHVLVINRYGRWVQVASPLPGWVEVYYERPIDNHSTILNQNVFDHASETDQGAKLVVNLYPVTHMMFNRHGSARLHISTCGHRIHYSCWETYCVGSINTALNQPNHSNWMALDEKHGEFACPLCKTISNCLIPFVNASNGKENWCNACDRSTSVDVNNVGKSGKDLTLQMSEKVTDLRSWIELVEDPSFTTSETVAIMKTVIPSILYRFLDSPIGMEDQIDDDVSNWRLDPAGVQLLDICTRQRKPRWSNVSDLKEETDTFFFSSADVDNRNRYRHTSGCHIMWSSIAYTLQSELLAGKFSKKKEQESNVDKSSSNPSKTLKAIEAIDIYQGAHPATICNEDFVKFSCSLLHTVRRMPRWFPDRGAFEECIATPLKQMVAGERIDHGGNDGHNHMDAKAATSNSILASEGEGEEGDTYTAFEKDLGLDNDGEKEAADGSEVGVLGGNLKIAKDFSNEDCRKALHSLSFKTFSDTKSFPSPYRFAKLQEEFYNRGVDSAELWAILSQPLLSHDLHGITLCCVAVSRDQNAAHTLISTMCYARLCQILIEPASTGILKQFNQQVNELIRDNKYASMSVFRKSASAEHLKSSGDDDKMENGEDGASKFRSVLVDTLLVNGQVAPLMLTLQKKLSAPLGIVLDVPSTEAQDIYALLLLLNLIMDAWIPFLEYAALLKESLNIAAGVRLSPASSSQDLYIDSTYMASARSLVEADSNDTLAAEFYKYCVNERLVKHLSHLTGLPLELKTLLSSESMLLLANRWADQLAYCESYRADSSVTTASSKRQSLSSTSNNGSTSEVTFKRGGRSTSPSGGKQWTPQTSLVNFMDIGLIRKRKSNISGGTPNNVCLESGIFGDSGSSINIFIDHFDEVILRCLEDIEASSTNASKDKDAGKWAESDYSELREQMREWNIMLTRYNDPSDAIVVQEAETLLKAADDVRKLGLIRSLLDEAGCSFKDIMHLRKCRHLALATPSEHLEVAPGSDIEPQDVIMANRIIASIEHKLVYKQKDKVARELGFSLLDYNPAPVPLIADLRSSKETTRQEDAPSVNFGSMGMEGDFGEEEDPETKCLSKEPLLSWRLVGIDPVHRYIDEDCTADNGLSTGDYTVPTSSLLPPVGDLKYMHRVTPFVASVHGSLDIHDLNGTVMPTTFQDLSHLGFSNNNRLGLIELPAVYTDMIESIKLPYTPKIDEQGRRNDEPALCLICGCIVNAGNRAKATGDLTNLESQLRQYPGECTIHARQCGGGVGIFLNLLNNWVLLMRSGRACKSPPLYLDVNGETGESRGQHRPLILSKVRYQKLEELYLRHQVASEVSRKRLNQDRNIRMHWY